MSNNYSSPYTQAIADYINKIGWTKYRLCKESGIPYSSLENIFARDTSPSVQMLEKICAALEVDAAELFQEPQQTPKFTRDEKLLLDKYRSLSRKDKKLLQVFASGLNHETPRENENELLEK